MRFARRIVNLATVLLGALVLAASITGYASGQHGDNGAGEWAAAPSAGKTAAGPGRLHVRLDEWSIDTGEADLRTGRTVVEIENAGEQEHELAIVRTDLPADELPRSLSGPSLELAGEIVLGEPHDHSAGDHEHITPGSTRKARARLTPGRYVLVCTIPGHYEAGQRTSITVR